MQGCREPLCLTCPKFIGTGIVQVTSTTTGRTHTALQGHTRDASCKSSYVVYLGECSKCGLQYVGRTWQVLKERFNQHRGCMRNAVTSSGHSTYFAPHFGIPTGTDGLGCSYDDLKIVPLEQIPENDDQGEPFTEEARKKVLADREKYWILKLRTMFPYGLNDRVDGMNQGHSIERQSGGLGQKSSCRHRSKKKRSPTSQLAPFQPAELLQTTETNWASGREWINILRKTVNTLRKQRLRELLVFVQMELPLSSGKAKRILVVMHDLLDTRLFRKERVAVVRARPRGGFYSREVGVILEHRKALGAPGGVAGGFDDCT